MPSDLQSERPARVLVCGATGYLGRYVVRAAHAHGFHVRALVRDEARLGKARESCDEVFVGQATDASTLAGLCDGIDVVISSLGNRTLARRPTCWEVDEQANLNILEQARAAGVRQFVFISVLGAAEARKIVPQFEARERVVDALRTGQVPWTVIRPSGFFNDMAEVLEMARRGSVWLIGDGRRRFNPIHGADLADFIVSRVGLGQALGSEYPAGGPEILSMREAGEQAFAALGRKPRFRRVPLWAARGLAAAVRPFNVNVSSLVSMMTLLAGRDAIAPAYGHHRLRDFYRELAAGTA